MSTITTTNTNVSPSSPTDKSTDQNPNPNQQPAPPRSKLEQLDHFLPRPLLKPHRNNHLSAAGTAAADSSSLSPSYTQEQIDLDPNGHLAFSPSDIDNPKTWSVPRRWLISILTVFLVVNATFASSSPSGCLQGISAEFGVDEQVAGLVITLFLLGYCAGPLIFAPLSEFYGRRWVFYGTFTGYVAFNFLCAFTPSFAGLLVGRFATGAMASAPLTNAPGVLADLWGPVERGNAMAVFSMMTFVGPALGPVVSGFLQLGENWRWNFYVLLIMGGVTEVVMLALPETLPSMVLVNKARRIREAKVPGFENVLAPVEAENRLLGGIFRVALTRPWKILVDPISFLLAIYLSVVYTLLYMLFTIYPIVFQQKRGWNSGVGELPLIGTVLGACIGGAMNFYVSSCDRKKLLAGYKSKAEDRLPLAMVGGVMFAVTMFWFAWTAEFNSIHWIVPTIAGAFLATSVLLLFVAFLTYLTDCYLMYTASAMAANTICRSACAAAAPLFTQHMFDALGVGGGGSLIGGVAVLLAPIPFLFYKYGEQLRKRSKFAPTPDLKDIAIERETSEDGDHGLDHSDEEAIPSRKEKQEV